MTFRTKVPNYKRDIFKLPALTGLLRNQANTVQEIIDLRRQKLDNYKQYLPIGSNTNYIDALLSDTVDVDRTLQIIDVNLESLNSFHIAVSYEALDDLIRANLCDSSTILVAPEFKRLCQKLIYKIRFFESDEVLKLLKCLSSLGLPEEAFIVQACFQMARHHINDFNYEELILLSNLLGNFNEKIEETKSLLVTLKKTSSILVGDPVLRIRSTVRK